MTRNRDFLLRPKTSADLPEWYAGERYNEDGDTIWLPVFHKTWLVPDFREAVGERTRGQAKAYAASEWGEDFRTIRARKVWMHHRSALTGGIDQGGWARNMAWECPRDAEGALPYWRLDYAPPKPRLMSWPNGVEAGYDQP
jgi:hypothetical protein